MVQKLARVDAVISFLPKRASKIMGGSLAYILKLRFDEQ